MTSSADAVLLGSLAADVATMREVLLASPTAPVQHCPGWSVTDLIRHHGGVHRWATRIVETGEPDEALRDETGPAAGDELAHWYDDGAARLIQVLERTDPTRTCWTFGRAPGVVGFWIRRQALEAAIHRWDARHAVATADDFTAEVAVAGITEVVDDLFPWQVALGRTPPLSASVGLRATDLDRTWTLLGSDPVASAAGELAGPAAALLLLWHRTDLSDPALAAHGSGPIRTELASTRFAP